MTRALSWSPESLLGLAAGWEAVARQVHADVGSVDEVPARWRGAVADEARRRARNHRGRGERLARAVVLAAAAARDGAAQLGRARDDVSAVVRIARAEGLRVADDGTVVRDEDPSALLVALSGGSSDVAGEFLAGRAEELSRQLTGALQRLAAADDDAARDIAEAIEGASGDSPDAAAPAIDGDWAARIAANRGAIAQAILGEAAGTPDAARRTEFYRTLLGEIDDPAGSGQRIDRQIVEFDPARDVVVELNGDLATADDVAVFVPGMNTLLVDSATDTDTARRFVTASRGKVAAITFLGGEFPEDDDITVALLEAANPRYALDMAPRLVAFSHDLDRAVEGTGREVAITYVGHSYGGAVLGTAEALGLTADRTLYVAAAGAGVGVWDSGDWHNTNPGVARYSMTAPTDPIQLVQGSRLSKLGADPDRMPGVVRLATGRYDDGRPMAGIAAHTDVITDEHSQAWRNVLAVISGDLARLGTAS